MNSAGRSTRAANIADRSRERAVLLNQLLLGAVVSFTGVLVVLLDQLRSQSLLVAGVGIVLGGCGVALLVPWNRLPLAATLLLPIADIVAIALLRQSSTTGGFGLLWAFPAMWIAASFGFAGLACGVVSVTLVYWGTVVADPTQQQLAASTILLPVTIAALSTISYLTARRTVAQRYVLDRQSQFLQDSLVRARRQEDLVTEILDAVDFGVIRVTTEGALLVSNDAHARLLRSPADDRAVYAADGATPITPELDPLARARRGEVFENQVVWYGAPAEGGRALSATVRPLRDPDGSAAGVVLVTRDVTAEELALRSREDLVASVSHELRTPLTSIMGYIDLALDSDELSDTNRERLEVVERNASRLLQIVADILSASARTRPGNALTVEPEQIDIAPVVRAAIEAASASAAERGITITGRAPDDMIAFADAHRVRQVVDNLISNAVKYNDDNGSVIVEVTRDGLFTWISVADDGPGIPEDELPRLFERFFRSDAVRNTGTHGSGLGLAISRDIVRAHGGEITVRTSLGRGTEFLVRLLSADPREEAA
ncbi:cell wall metabolism sensor histidine kinase WalK [uncultured Microbacterium sp.]|uniref:sensor histidine kinase n=1 Tax=uncultured Microbacterium sp. TaxID=191216 RepID=UPI0025F32551|nr:PAS domain-containing sensor histidine kinase [uncultured Microbacterium sp.]